MIFDLHPSSILVRSGEAEFEGKKSEAAWFVNLYGQDWVIGLFSKDRKGRFTDKLAAVNPKEVAWNSQIS